MSSSLTAPTIQKHIISDAGEESYSAVNKSSNSVFLYGLEITMPMYETTVRTPQGDVKDRVYAKDLQEARMLFEQRHGPRNVPYIPKVVPS